MKLSMSHEKNANIKIKIKWITVSGCNAEAFCSVLMLCRRPSGCQLPPTTPLPAGVALLPSIPEADHRGEESNFSPTMSIFQKGSLWSYSSPKIQFHHHGKEKSQRDLTPSLSWPLRRDPPAQFQLIQQTLSVLWQHKTLSLSLCINPSWLFPLLFPYHLSIFPQRVLISRGREREIEGETESWI